MKQQGPPFNWTSAAQCSQTKLLLDLLMQTLGHHSTDPGGNVICISLDSICDSLEASLQALGEARTSKRSFDTSQVLVETMRALAHSLYLPALFISYSTARDCWFDSC